MASHDFPLPASWPERVEFAKAHPLQADRMLRSIIAEANGNHDWIGAEQYAIDAGDYTELDYLIAMDDNFSRGLDDEGYPLDACPDLAWSDADKVRMFGGYR